VRSDCLVTNPDDPDGDAVEAIAWWDPADLPGNTAVRPELLAGIGDVMAALASEPDEVAKAGDGDGPKASWPGWELDGPAVAYWAPQVTEAVSRALTPAVLDRMAMSYLAANPAQQGDAPGKRDRNGAAAAWLAEWLGASGITLPLAAVAEGIVTGGYLIGAVSATALVNGQSKVTDAPPPGDTQGALRQAAFLGLDAALSAFLAGAVTAAVSAITGAFTGVLSRVLGGVTGGTSMRDLGDQLAEAVADPGVAEGAAMDQVTGASGQAAQDIYAAQDIAEENLITEGDARVCPECDALAAANPHPAGSLVVPVHFGCRCGIGPG
jgi:hypothetical protein